MAAFSVHKSKLDEIANRIQTERARLARIRSDAVSASANLNSMGTEYGPTIAEINADAAANPTSEARQHNASEAAELVAEFQALLVEAQALEAAVGTVAPSNLNGGA